MRPKGALTVQATAQAELIAPGKNKLTVVYKGKTYTAGLGRTGNILFNGAAHTGCLILALYDSCQVQGRPRHASWQ